MAKSRVEKNKTLYEELELNSFELEDISEAKKEEKLPSKQENIQVEEVKEVKKQELVPVKKTKKNEVAIVEKNNEQIEDDFVVTQPISYTDKLSVEEILREKLEKQQKLRNDKKIYKKSPFTETYTPEMMQKSINQQEGVDVRKEVNIKVKKGNNVMVAILILLLIAVIAAGILFVYFVL